MAPYPAELETSEMLQGGAVVRLRPVRPEDEPLLQNFAAVDGRASLWASLKDFVGAYGYSRLSILQRTQAHAQWSDVAGAPGK